MNKKYLFLIVLTFYTHNAKSQNTSISEIDNLIESKEYRFADEILNKIDTLYLNEKEKAKYYYYKGKILDSYGKYDLAFLNFKKAKLKFQSENLTEDAMLMNYNLAFASTFDISQNVFIDELGEYALNRGSDNIKAKYYYLKGYQSIKSEDFHNALKYLNFASKYIERTTDTIYMHRVNSFIGLLYSQVFNNPKKALEHELKYYNYFVKNKKFDDIVSSKINQATAYRILKDYKNSINLLKEATILADSLNEFRLTHKQHIYKSLMINYEEINDYKSALYYSNLSNQYADSTANIEISKAINDYKIQYESEKKSIENKFLKQENEILDQRNKLNRIIIYISLGLSVLVLLVSYLIIRILKRRKKIIEQEKVIEIQKRENLIKTQELNIIDAIIEGQEKERQNIANDLHDNLGSMLTSLKLNFQYLKNQFKQQDNYMFEKTEQLIDDAYQNIRKIAHAKNSGVIGDKGLIPALKLLAEKTSIKDKLNIEVVSNEMNSRIELSNEITIFRCIQELVTNSIKHGKATKISINLTQHDDELIIMVEDNGEGFKKNIQEGFGLTNIRKRIKNLNGILTIDSNNYGTTIIINIPL